MGYGTDARGLGTDEAIALLWTVPWDGQESMPLSRVHPLFVEICRWAGRMVSARGRHADLYAVDRVVDCGSPLVNCKR